MSESVGESIDLGAGLGVDGGAETEAELVEEPLEESAESRRRRSRGRELEGAELGAGVDDGERRVERVVIVEREWGASSSETSAKQAYGLGVTGNVKMPSLGTRVTCVPSGKWTELLGLAR